MKKKMYVMACAVMLACVVFGCGKKKEDPKDVIRKDVVGFVNEELVSIQPERDEAIGIYNAYFENEDLDIGQFLADLQATAIPDMESYITKLTAIEVETEEVAGLKDLYLQSAQKQCDAMKMVASAIEEENPEFLTQADTMIAESVSLMVQYESELKLLSIDNDITINGSFTQ